MKRLLVLLALLFGIIGSAFGAVNVNTAGKEALQSLKGIGPAKAQAIIDYRAKHGPFKTVDDLEKVQGIGAKTLEAIRKDVTVTGAKDAKAGDKEATKPATK